MIRGKQYKLNIYHSKKGSKDQNRITGQLFDMQNDPQEFRNLWFDPAYREIKEKLLIDLLNWEIQQESYLETRGGDSFPDPTKRLNNKL